MLIFTRRIGETVVIGENIVFTVLDVKGSQVRLGLDAPRDVSVHRHEVFLKVMAERVAKDQELGVDFQDPRTSVLTHRASLRLI